MADTLPMKTLPERCKHKHSSRKAKKMTTHKQTLSMMELPTAPIGTFTIDNTSAFKRTRTTIKDVPDDNEDVVVTNMSSSLLFLASQKVCSYLLDSNFALTHYSA